MTGDRNERTDDTAVTEASADPAIDTTELRRQQEAIDHTVEALCNRLVAGDPTDEDVAAAVREADELVTRLRDAHR